MWLTEEDKEKQQRLETLIGWELRKQFNWIALFLTSFLGLISLHALDVSNWPFAVIYFSLLAGTNVSLYRVATSSVLVANWTNMLPSKFQRRLLTEEQIMGLFLRLIQKRNKNMVSLRKTVFYPAIAIFDVLLTLAFLLK